MERAELSETLEEAGLSPYQADAYITVLELGAAPVTRIADASGVPDPRIYDVLRDLESTGYIETYERESMYARANDLDAIVDDLKSRASRFAAATEEIERRWNEPSVEQSTVTIVTRFETVIKNADEFIRGAESQVNVSVAVDDFEQLRPALRDATERGVRVNLSIHTPEDEAAALPDPEALSDVCSEARHRRLPSPFAVIVDRTKTCFAPHAGSTNEYGVLVDDRTHTYVFHWYFLTTQWDTWEPIYSSIGDEPPIEYVDIRYCVRDVAPLVRDGATVRVRIEGTDTESGATRTVEGELSEILVTGTENAADVDVIASYGGQVALVVETDEGPVEVGGWGAMVEDIEAHRITLVGVA
ncbi:MULTISPECIES: TrmB family transcriptional regulator [Halorubrum]|uniref:TrmB family transcriptional regulator n=1 Tax=Halorubrum ezzemoulense TaxID=337243 RepID=A0A256K7J6_HALEZ|nr:MULTISPECIES: TrmB family transcriptional regulator [Halorubrum]OYR75999.1 TrmB family transcriptional regulator [Halorubrum ezzemoulense]OYR77031.1 TrmB family transcriptional regulator [Halorubrum ezzemoulense]PHQ40881.1 TrmB family transcriptional regulator [Halorubrum sp. C191]QAY19715.1 TrmB family transcriptional regulator [Halorubrum ezzemoulense]